MESSFIAIDGDDVGNILRNHIVSNDIQGASEYSKSLNKFFDGLAVELQDKGCEIVFCGGDSVLAIANSKDATNFVLSISNPIHPISIGIGKSAELAYLALQLAKARGKAQIVVIDNVVANTIKTW
jgi:GTP cyclohydrolase III